MAKYLRSKPCKKVNQNPKEEIGISSSIIHLSNLWLDGLVLNSITMTSFIFFFLSLSVYHACLFPIKELVKIFPAAIAASSGEIFNTLAREGGDFSLAVCMANGRRGIDDFFGQETDCRKIPM
ncbi:hypothetical protein CEXT_70921 [Caerostris extrusa]|uniref:Uncharacterized protein n=1 Tax=Caerostris extrusa TaxID=172846 RepID=A0AAV4MWB8_CAEEX|nr:hypothetical protein CEXT_70921 [Caerostris extrusa]